MKLCFLHSCRLFSCRDLWNTWRKFVPIWRQMVLLLASMQDTTANGKKKKNQSKISREHIISVPKVWRAVKSTNSVLFSRWARIAGTILVNRGVKVYLYSVFTPTPYVVSNNWEEFVDVLLHTIFYKIVWAFNVYYFDQHGFFLLFSAVRGPQFGVWLGYHDHCFSQSKAWQWLQGMWLFLQSKYPPVDLK